MAPAHLVGLSQMAWYINRCFPINLTKSLIHIDVPSKCILKISTSNAYIFHINKNR